MSSQINITDHILNYIRENSLRENETLKLLREETHLLPQHHMQIPPEQGQFLSLLIKLLNARKTLEVGIFTGYSTLCTALALPENGKIFACDFNNEWLEIAKRYWKQSGVDHKIEVLFGDANDTLKQLTTQPDMLDTFDFAFIDADKVSYDNYYEYALQLIRPGGLIVLDNTLWSGAVADSSVTNADTTTLRNLNKKLLDDERVDISMLPYSDGLTLIMKRKKFKATS